MAANSVPRCGTLHPHIQVSGSKFCTQVWYLVSSYTSIWQQVLYPGVVPCILIYKYTASRFCNQVWYLASSYTSIWQQILYPGVVPCILIYKYLAANSVPRCGTLHPHIQVSGSKFCTQV